MGQKCAVKARNSIRHRARSRRAVREAILADAASLIVIANTGLIPARRRFTLTQARGTAADEGNSQFPTEKHSFVVDRLDAMLA